MAKIVLTINADNKATQSVQALNKEVQALSKTLSSIQVNKNLTTQINALTKHYTALASAATKVNTATARRQLAEQKLATEIKRGRTEDERTLRVRAQRQQAEENLKKSEIDRANAEVRLQRSQINLKKAETDLTKAQKKRTVSTKQATTTTDNHRQSILSMIPQIIKWQAAMTAVMLPIRGLKSLLSSLNETLVVTEDAVIALQRVLPNGSATNAEIASNMYDIAQRYGQTFENVQQIATNFARTGMDWADTIKATESAVLALNVAELDATEASDGMIAILSQFGLKAEDLQLVVDKLNITADNAAVTTEKLLAALQRTGSAAKNANLTLDETLAIITALSEATGRSGQNLGTAINSLIQYSSKASALDTFAALSKDTAAVVAEFKKGGATILDVWRQVSKEIQNLKAEQADLLDSYFSSDDGAALKDALDGELQDIYTELGGVYDTANTFRKNYFIALLGNMGTVEQALGTLGDAAGYSQEENVKYLNTYTAQVNSLKATWEGLTADESSWGEFKKSIVIFGDAILSIIQDVGGLSEALTYLVSSTLLVVATFKTLTGGINPVAKLIISLSQSIYTLGERMKNLGGTGKTVKAAFSSLKTAYKDIKDYLKKDAEAQKAAKVATDAHNASTATLADTTATEEMITAASTVATHEKAAADKAATVATDALTTATASLSAVINILTIAVSAAVIIIQAIVSVVQKSKQADEEAAEAMREHSQELNENVAALNEQNEALFDNVQSLDAYIKKVEDANATEEDRQEALSEIISISGELLDSYGLENDAILLLTTSYSGLSDELDRYIGKAKDLAAEKAKEAYEEAKNATAEAQKAQNATSASIKLTGNNESVRRGLIESGITTGMSKQFGRTEGVGVYGTVALDFDATKEDLATLEEWYDLIDQHLNEDISNGSRNEAKRASAAVLDAINKIKNALSLVDDAANNELTAWARNELLNNAELSDNYYGAQGNGQENHEAMLRLQDLIRTNTEYTEEQRQALQKLVTEELRGYLGKYEAIVDENAKLYNDITKVTEAYDDLIKKLEELRDAEKESLELEEKKQAVLEAQNALEAAQNEATVRRYNDATGQWEWQTDEKKIADAEKDLEKARQNLEEQAYETIIDQLKEQTATNESILAIINDLAPYLGADFANGVKGAILESTGVDLDKPINEFPESASSSSAFQQAQQYIDNHGFREGDRARWEQDQNFLALWQQLTEEEKSQLKGKAYDSGGVASGLGFMPKATSRPESVNDPELTAKILSPVSNDQFNRYVHDMGIMFELAKQYAQAPVVEHIGGAVDNRVDNRGQIIFGGGLTVGADHRGSSMDELLDIGGIVPKA